MTEDIVARLLLGFGAWVMLCRIYHMEPGVTRRGVVIQHAAFAMGLFAAAVLPDSSGVRMLCVAVGALAFMLMSATRWKDGAPAGTERAATSSANGAIRLAADDMRHVAGGSDN